MDRPLFHCRLYAFVDAAFLHGRAPEDIARQLCDGGADLIQLRAKQATTAEVQRMAERILPVTRSAGVGLVINDHLAVARAVGAPICHLGQEDFAATGCAQVRELFAKPTATRRQPTDATPQPSTLNHQPLIGLSTHSPTEAQRAMAAGADYVGVGPVFATGTKPEATPVTLDYIRWAAANVTIPWFAIGGINLGNLDAVMAAGARRICVVSAILDAPDITGACRRFKERLLCAAI
ncbi:MAG: thiamine phosphate synthase [Verrucomicrobiota bacterium]|jgi:thiamine-phosphate pyrophosphorylase